MRIACVENVSAYAFRTRNDLLPGPLDLVSPAESFRLAAGGHVEAALLPSPALRLLPEMRPLPFGIACEGAVGTVVLCSMKPLWQLLRDQSPCHVPSFSLTSRALFRQLCQRTYGVTPFMGQNPLASAHILMGDDAADLSRAEFQWPIRIDLGSWWLQLTQLPFVFAQWAVRRDLGPGEQAALEMWLEECARRAAVPDGVSSMVERATSKGLFRACPLQAQRYYLRLRHRMGPRESDGLEEFLKKEKGTLACARIA